MYFLQRKNSRNVNKMYVFIHSHEVTGGSIIVFKTNLRVDNLSY